MITNKALGVMNILKFNQHLNIPTNTFIIILMFAHILNFKAFYLVFWNKIIQSFDDTMYKSKIIL